MFHPKKKNWENVEMVFNLLHDDISFIMLQNYMFSSRILVNVNVWETKTWRVWKHELFFHPKSFL